MRIAMFSDNFYPELSGITDSILTIGKEFVARGHSILYCYPHYSKKDYRLLNRPEMLDMGPNVEFISLPSVPFPTGTGQGRMAIPIGTSFSRLKRFNPDIIHCHLIFGAGIEGWMASKILKRPLVGTNHTPMVEFLKYSPIPADWIKDLVLRYDGWFYSKPQFVSSPTHFIFERMKYFRERVSHATISNPIKVDAFQPVIHKTHLKEKYGLSHFAILYTGRLAEEKSIDIILRAIAKVKKSIPEISFGIVGRGANEQQLRDLTKSLNIQDNVKFFGFVPQEALAEIYNASDVFAIMSTAETQCISAMQALACDIPVIAADAWGLKEYITDEIGFRIPPGDVDGLAEKIMILYQDPALRKKMGAAGRTHVAKFSPKNIADRWETIYQKVIDDRKASSQAEHRQRHLVK